MLVARSLLLMLPLFLAAPADAATITSADLAPFPIDSPEGRSADALRVALSHFEAGELEAALAALGGAGDAFAADEVAWLRGQALWRLDRHAEADAAWAGIQTDQRRYGEALLARARLAVERADPDAVLALLDGTSGDGAAWRRRADVQMGLALRDRGQHGDPERAYELLKAVWIAAPQSGPGEEARLAMDSLEAQVPAALHANLAEQVQLAASLGRSHANEQITALLDPQRGALRDRWDSAPTVACTGTYELGRAYHKLRRYSESVALLADAAKRCPDEATRVKATYLQAQDESRSGLVSDSVKHFTSLADNYPHNSYADDGLFHAGHLELQEGRPEAARLLFERQIREFPDGDMSASTTWGLAWAAWTEEDWPRARRFLKQLADGDPWGPERDRVLQGQYWMARVLQREGHADEARQAWRGLATEQPHHYYGVLALWRLQQVDAPAAAAVVAEVTAQRDAVRSRAAHLDAWSPQDELLEQPGYAVGLDLLRGGLGELAALELRRALGPRPWQRWGLPTLLFASHLLERAGDPHTSHNLLRMTFREAFPALRPLHAAALRHAYPRAFGELLDGAVGDAFPRLLFQGLVREESGFDPAVVSWAGAIGLSQLMWPTAKETARRMGRSVTRSSLRDPQTNLEVGAHYLRGLTERWKGHLPLAVASYNAGPGAVRRWVDARGDLDLDAWVETIPYDQTRDYVKRVTQSHQIYQLLYGEGGPFVPLRVGPVAASIAGSDPTL